MPSPRVLSRRSTARRIREEAAEVAFLRPHSPHLNNGEETTYHNPPPAGGLNYIANFSKGLPHNALGEVVPTAYRALLRALTSGDPNDFEQIPLGPGGRRFTNPQAGLAFDLEGPDAQSLTQPPAPRIDSPENSAEMGELYWMALLRDVPFRDYATDPNAATAAASLTNQFSDFRGPTDGAGNVTPDTLFRGFTAGDLPGPYVSQFLLRDIKYGSLTLPQRQRTVVPGVDYLTNFGQWLLVQNGDNTRGCQDQFDLSNLYYIRNLRDLANYVHFDALYEAYLNACLILLNIHVPANLPCNPAGPGGAPFDPGNSYTGSLTQDGFGTFGGPHILSLVTEVATRALKAVWYQKWFVHRRLRPEAFGGLVHQQVTGAANYPIDPEILDTSPGSVLEAVNNYNTAQFGDNTYLLPQAFPEGSPTHPAYGAGHATVAGACVTILKAWFDESYVIPNPVEVDAAGTGLAPLGGGLNLTVGGELNKLAANIAIGRNGGGVHWRSDYTQSLLLGEEIATGILEEQKLTYNENHSFTFTRFDGTGVTI